MSRVWMRVCLFERASGGNADVTVDTAAGQVTGQEVGVAVSNQGDGSSSVAVANVVAQGTAVQVAGNQNAAITVLGNVTGDVGIDTTGLADESGRGTEIEISGQVTGTGGTALQLGDGVHAVSIFEALAPVDPVAQFMSLSATNRPSIIGDTMFGLSDDSLSFDTLSAQTGLFDGVFDGGAGTDTVFFDFALDLFAGATLFDENFEVEIFGPSRTNNILRFSNFEFFSFGESDQPLSAGMLLDIDVVTPVPLPAGWVLLGSALAALGWRRRQRGAALTARPER